LDLIARSQPHRLLNLQPVNKGSVAAFLILDPPPLLIPVEFGVKSTAEVIGHHHMALAGSSDGDALSRVKAQHVAPPPAMPNNQIAIRFVWLHRL
jgi:hypothetical protein